MGLTGLYRQEVCFQDTEFQTLMEKNSENLTVTAKQLSTLVEETYDTIDHWADRGLLPYTKKGRIRHFPRAESIYRCKKIRQLQNKDFNLAAIRDVLLNGHIS